MLILLGKISFKILWQITLFLKNIKADYESYWGKLEIVKSKSKGDYTKIYFSWYGYIDSNYTLPIITNFKM